MALCKPQTCAAVGSGLDLGEYIYYPTKYFFGVNLYQFYIISYINPKELCLIYLGKFNFFSVSIT